MTNQPEKASASVALTLQSGEQVPNFFYNNQMYSKNKITLLDFDRAALIAGGYQQFKITSVKLIYKPSLDTFLASTTELTVLKPQFYFMLNRGNIPSNITLEGLKQMGAKAMTFDEKPVRISFKPLVPQLVDGGGATSVVGVGGIPAKSMWLSTAADPQSGVYTTSEVEHIGIFWYVDCPNAAAKAYAYTIDMEVQFCFRKPAYQLDVSNTVEAVEAQTTRTIKTRLI
jgi:hypothetical protein